MEITSKSYLSLLLVVPFSSGLTAEELQKMLVDVNSTTVEPDEVLSGRLLKYVVEEGMVSFALAQ